MANNMEKRSAAVESKVLHLKASPVKPPTPVKPQSPPNDVTTVLFSLNDNTRPVHNKENSSREHDGHLDEAFEDSGYLSLHNSQIHDHHGEEEDDHIQEKLRATLLPPSCCYTPRKDRITKTFSLQKEHEPSSSSFSFHTRVKELSKAKGLRSDKRSECVQGGAVLHADLGLLKYSSSSSSTPASKANSGRSFSQKSHTPNCTRFTEYMQAASSLKQHESLRPCKRCGSPATHLAEVQRATCTRSSCPLRLLHKLPGGLPRLHPLQSGEAQIPLPPPQINPDHTRQSLAARGASGACDGALLRFYLLTFF
ncbi:F-box only protein 5 [Nibea albiflora]|uniref:F-box only protein 5 n=1 Tax=Nibea albiflora TaxID=240163 RepID=A0ACB7EEE2_NIBAL|nr:F-box only protein 5 [Nibea albiflora]